MPRKIDPIKKKEVTAIKKETKKKFEPSKEAYKRILLIARKEYTGKFAEKHYKNKTNISIIFTKLYAMFENNRYSNLQVAGDTLIRYKVMVDASLEMYDHKMDYYKQISVNQKNFAKSVESFDKEFHEVYNNILKKSHDFTKIDQFRPLVMEGARKLEKLARIDFNQN